MVNMYPKGLRSITARKETKLFLSKYKVNGVSWDYVLRDLIKEATGEEVPLILTPKQIEALEKKRKLNLTKIQARGIIDDDEGLNIKDLPTMDSESS